MKQDVFWVHLIRALSVVFVVLLHAAAQVLQLGTPYGSPDWWYANIIDSALRMCVPLLFMISGYLLLPKQETISNFMKKRMNKILIPLLFWSLFYAAWLVFVESNQFSPITPFAEIITKVIVDGFPFTLVAMSFTPVYYHLWFMYALIGLYLCMPILRVLVQNSSRTLLWYFIGLWSVTTFFFPILTEAKFFVGIELRMVTGPIGYLVLGYLLGTANINKKWCLPATAGFIGSVAITAIGTWWLSDEGNLNQFFYGSTPNILLMTVTAFILLKITGEKIQSSDKPMTNQFNKLVLQMSKAAFGIYLIHAMFLYLFHSGLVGFKLDSVQGPAFIYIPLTATAVYIASFAVIKLFQATPILRKVAP